MENFILFIHVLIAVAIIGLIMLQQGKGAEMGASFGSGSSQTVFGAAGSGNLFSKLTAVLATIFFVTSFGLAIIAKDNAVIQSDDFDIPELESVTGEAAAVEEGLKALEEGLEAIDVDDATESVIPDAAESLDAEAE